MSRADRKEIFNPYCDLAAPRERIEELCEKYPTIAPAIEAWKKKRMEDPKLLAKYENLKDFVDFNLSQFLQLTSEFSVREADGADKKIFSRNVNFDKKLHGFKDVIEAIKEVPASKESPELQTIVGSWYSYGDTYDQINAREFFIRAAAQGYAPAQHTFGICHQQGLGVIIPHKDEARALYQKAADQGLAKAQNALGACHEKGIGGPKDEDKARELFQLAADQGLAEAQFNLGVCHEKGIGGPKDEGKARELYQLAADQKHTKAQFNLGVCYEKGIGGKQNEFEAERLYYSAAVKGYAPAQNNLGTCHEHGAGGVVRRNGYSARKFYQLAADQGLAAAQNNLGVCHEKGIGGPKDEAEARKFYQSAADQGHAKAQNNLGACYQNGIGGEKDSSLALLYYSRGAAQKSPDAINILKLSDHSKLKIIPPHTPLDKDQIIEIINNLAPEKVRIFNKASHIIGDLVEASKGKLKEADLFEIQECLSGHLTASKVDPMKSKSCKKIQEVIAEKRKSEIDVGLAGEISHSGFDGEGRPAKFGHVEVINPLHERGMNFRIEDGSGGVKTVINPLLAAAVLTLDQKLQEMQKAEKLTYNSESKTITVTKANLETFSAMSVPASDVAGAGAGAVVGGAAVRREGGGSGGGGGGSGRG